MYLLLLLLLSVTLWDVRSSKAKCPSFATLKIEELPAPAVAPQVTLVCTFTYHDGVILPKRSDGYHQMGMALQTSREPLSNMHINFDDPVLSLGVLKVTLTLNRMLWNERVRCAVNTPGNHFCEKVVTISKTERQIAQLQWSDSRNCNGATLKIEELPAPAAEAHATLVCKLVYNDGVTPRSASYWMKLSLRSSDDPLKLVYFASNFASSTMMFTRTLWQQEVHCVVVNGYGEYCQAEYTIPPLSTQVERFQVEQYHSNSYPDCPAGATIEIDELPESTYPQVSFECKFTYNGGPISNNEPYDHHLGWYEMEYAIPDAPIGKPWATYDGLENPSGIIEGEHPNLTVFKHDTVEGGEGLIQEFKVDMTEMFGDPHVLTSTITFSRSIVGREIRCLVFTSDYHRCESNPIQRIP